MESTIELHCPLHTNVHTASLNKFCTRLCQFFFPPKWQNSKFDFTIIFPKSNPIASKNSKREWCCGGSEWLAVFFFVVVVWAYLSFFEGRDTTGGDKCHLSYSQYVVKQWLSRIAILKELVSSYCANVRQVTRFLIEFLPIGQVGYGWYDTHTRKQLFTSNLI